MCTGVWVKTLEGGRDKEEGVGDRERWKMGGVK